MILVTGGMGLIGHNVVAKLIKKKQPVCIVDTMTNYGIIPQDELVYLMSERAKKFACDEIYRVDISDRELIGAVFAKHRIRTVIHLASFPRQKVVNADPQLGSRAMSEGLLNLLEYASRNRVDRFVYASSSMVYGDFEDQVTEDSPCRPQGQYGIMKLAGEWLVRDIPDAPAWSM